jgi:hypothetical protein
VYVLPAIVTDPLREELVFAETLTVTDPFPVPLVGDRLTQERLSDVVQEQLELEAVTETELVPPLEL